MRSPPVAERRLKFGIAPPRKSGGRFKRRSATRQGVERAPVPGVETPGYPRPSLRDGATTSNVAFRRKNAYSHRRFLGHSPLRHRPFLGGIGSTAGSNSTGEARCVRSGEACVAGLGCRSSSGAPRTPERRSTTGQTPVAESPQLISQADKKRRSGPSAKARKPGGARRTPSTPQRPHGAAQRRITARDAVFHSRRMPARVYTRRRASAALARVSTSAST